MNRNLRNSGILFLCAGLAWIVAAALGRQVVFSGVGLAFIAIGTTYLAKARKRGAN